jgi:HEAT repeat protein
MRLFRKQRELIAPAARWVSQDEDPEVLDLLRALDDQDPDRRWYAILQMWRQRDMAVVPLLIALEDVSDRVRTVAAQGLGHTGEERAVAPLLAVLLCWLLSSSG